MNRLTRTHFWPETIAFLRSLSKVLPEDAVLVNIGAYWESSTISILMDRPDVFAFSIDPEACETGLENVRHFGMEDRVVRILGKSQDIDWRFSIDALYVDGDHCYRACRADIENWTPWVKDGGLVFFHDHGTEHAPGVVKAVAEAMGDFEYIGRDRPVEDRGVLVAYRK